MCDGSVNWHRACYLTMRWESSFRRRYAIDGRSIVVGRKTIERGECALG